MESTFIKSPFWEEVGTENPGSSSLSAVVCDEKGNS